jgi:hypothetical protein
MIRIVIAALLLASCSSTGGDESVAPATEGCAHVIDATISSTAAGYTISATVSSADTGWDKYADAWEVRDEQGLVLGERVLAHPHETEQPFTRSLTGVQIAEEVGELTIAARDSVLGFCGEVFVVEVPVP